MIESSTPPPDSLFADDLAHAILDVSLMAINLLRPLYGPEGELVDFALEYLNPAGQQMIGLPERPGITLLTRFPHCLQNGVFAFYRQVFETGEKGQLEVDYHYDGLDSYFHLAARRHGQLLVVSFNDTATQDRTAAEEALRQSRARERAARAEAEAQRQQLHKLLMQAPACIANLAGPEHTFTLVNPSYQQLVGERQLLGKPVREALPELEGQPFFALLDEVYRTGETYFGNEQAAYLDRTNSGRLEPVYFNYIYQPVRDASGAVTDVVIFAFDVTGQVHGRQLVQNLNEEMASANEELQAANEEFLLNNARLHRAQLQLQELNQELETRVAERTGQLQQAQQEAERQRLRLERLFMQAPAAICILDGPDLVFELVNPGYQQLFPGRALLGRPIAEALPEIADHKVYHTFRRVYETGITHQEEALHIPLARPGDGELENRYFRYLQQARHDEQGRVDGILVFAFEITEQVQAHQASQASAYQLRLITDALPVLIGYLDRDEKYRFANQAYQEWFNRPPQSLLGVPVREVLGEAAYHGIKKYIDRALAGERLDYEARMPYREDFVKHIRTSYIPDIRPEGVAGFFTLVTDITDQVQARQLVDAANEQLRQTNMELDERNQQLRRTNVDLDNFIYSASHDLKAPITNIEGLLHLLQSQLSEPVLHHPEVAPVLAMMQDSVDRFQRTIDHLSDVTKLQKEHNQPSTEVSLAEVVEDVRMDLAPQLQQAGARLEIDASHCPSVMFSAKNLRSVVYNLLSNALKYRHPDRQPHVRISCRQEPEYIVLAVEDNGLGLTPVQQAELFTMFRRLHSHVEGSGIGLYMVKRSVENAGGKVEVSSEPGLGSTFSVYFRR